eukprot:TRINITY_DN67701_c7_g1_i1.p2 TRINITY_DN67701_c7_g1~~TRINITY_DN67701_c7_g1_i1.p2  ORF type:complete len:145 (-),score=14.25 TRINITY_DN67701_c7_g1_i1:64-498(-)
MNTLSTLNGSPRKTTRPHDSDSQTRCLFKESDCTKLTEFITPQTTRFCSCCSTVVHKYTMNELMYFGHEHRWLQKPPDRLMNRLSVCRYVLAVEGGPGVAVETDVGGTGYESDPSGFLGQFDYDKFTPTNKKYKYTPPKERWQV